MSKLFLGRVGRKREYIDNYSVIWASMNGTGRAKACDWQAPGHRCTALEIVRLRHEDNAIGVGRDLVYILVFAHIWRLSLGPKFR